MHPVALHESGENYLEAILLLQEKMGAVRAVDVARELHFSKPSISRAMNILRDSGLIAIDSRNFITLTEEGLKIAQEVSARHFFLTRFLIGIGVPKAIAENDACRMEHVLSPETFEMLQKFVADKGGENP